MLKVLSSEQIRQADSASIQKEGISSAELMERAATEAYKAISFQLPLDQTAEVAIFCGMGNNGGDGLVIGRLLQQAGVKPRMFVLQTADKGSADFELNLQRLKGSKADIQYLNKENHDFDIPANSFLIDAIFGSGINKPIKGFVKKIVQKINSLPNRVFSIDMPSGLFPEDNSGNDKEAIVRANETFCFESPRLSFFFPENNHFLGDWHVLPIGLDRTFIQGLKADCHYVQQSDAAKMLKKRDAFGHKGSYGHSLIYAGSYGKMGAAVLAAKACLRAGTGLLSMRVPRCGYEIMQLSAPESMVEADTRQEYLEGFLDDAKYSAVGIGPGIGMKIETAEMLKQLLQHSSKAMVLDADALNILSENKELFSHLAGQKLLTPHPGEFKRLVGEWKNDYERYLLLKDFAEKQNTYVLLKGKFSALACPNGRLYFNSTGNPGMATGGSGDVLTGILVSLLAQGYELPEAALLGMYLHGLAADLAVLDSSEQSLLAGDIVDYISEAYRSLEDIVLKG